MKLSSLKLSVAALVAASHFQTVNAALVSSSNVGGIIAAPALVTNAAVTNTQQQGFNERQGVTLAADLDVDAVADIPAGTVVDSHMIFLNKAGSGTLNDLGVVWTFDGPILGVMSDSNGSLEAASTSFLGAIGSTYEAPFGARGLESNDSYSFTPGSNVLTVSMRVSQPGDWIRVVTAANVPDAPLGTGLVAFALALGAVAARRQIVAA